MNLASKMPEYDGIEEAIIYRSKFHNTLYSGSFHGIKGLYLNQDGFQISWLYLLQFKCPRNCAFVCNEERALDGGPGGTLSYF